MTSTTSTSGSSTSSDGGGATVHSCPGWPGWEAWDDFAPQCPLCVPASKEALPPPIDWEPCDPSSEMSTGCQQMKPNWSTSSTPFGYAAAVDVRSDDTAVIEIVRVSWAEPDPWTMHVIAEADGEVLSAMLDRRGKESIDGCSFLMTNVVSMAQGSYAVKIYGGDIDHSPPTAVVGGPVDELHPSVQHIWDQSGGEGVAASNTLWATANAVRVGVASWGESWKEVFNSSQAGLQQVKARAFGEFVTWRSSNGIYAGLMAWTPSSGAYAFITYPGDFSQGAWGLGTDGVHMVWTHSEGKGAANEAYPAGSVMVSPYTTEPAALVPTKLRSYPSPHYIQPTPWIVGCGYAAIAYQQLEVIIVRLSDGWSWVLTTPNPDASPYEQWRFSTVYGISCDEVFLRAAKGPHMNIARVRLDALGPGIAPD